jgi:hypothetical protein
VRHRPLDRGRRPRGVNYSVARVRRRWRAAAARASGANDASVSPSIRRAESEAPEADCSVGALAIGGAAMESLSRGKYTSVVPAQADLDPADSALGHLDGRRVHPARVGAAGAARVEADGGPATGAADEANEDAARVESRPPASLLVALAQSPPDIDLLARRGVEGHAGAQPGRTPVLPGAGAATSSSDIPASKASNSDRITAETPARGSWFPRRATRGLANCCLDGGEICKWVFPTS